MVCDLSLALCDQIRIKYSSKANFVLYKDSGILSFGLTKMAVTQRLFSV